MRLRPRPLCAVLVLALLGALAAPAAAAPASQPASRPAPAAAPAAAPPDERAVLRVLPLCSSPERATRRFCVEEILRLGDPARAARARLRELAVRDADLSPLAGEAVRTLYREAAPTFDPGSEELAGANLMLAYPSGWTTPKRRLSVSAIYGAYWDVNYGVTDWLEVGARTTTPVGLFIFAPQFKLSKTFDGGAVALHGLAGVFLPYWLDTTSLALVGGGPTLSLGTPARYLNLGVEAYSLLTENYNITVLLPHAGAISRITRRLSLALDVVIPGIWSKRYTDFGLGKQAVVLYGLRITGRDMWGDISFAAPICHGCGKVYNPFVLGIPLLGLGFLL